MVRRGPPALTMQYVIPLSPGNVWLGREDKNLASSGAERGGSRQGRGGGERGQEQREEMRR